MDRVEKAREIYNKLKALNPRRGEKYTSKIAERFGDPFKLLIATILSQNTSDRNSIRAFKSLDEDIGIDVDRLLDAGVSRISEAIKIAGLHRVKAEKIWRICRVIREEYDGDISRIFNDDPGKVRDRLLKLPGVGEKTADIMLMAHGYPSFPVDTHIKRISHRLGLVDKPGYREVRSIWMDALKPWEYEDAHLQLIGFGRKICRSRRPRCSACPFRDICIYHGD